MGQRNEPSATEPSLSVSDRPRDSLRHFWPTVLAKRLGRQFWPTLTNEIRALEGVLLGTSKLLLEILHLQSVPRVQPLRLLETAKLST